MAGDRRCSVTTAAIGLGRGPLQLGRDEARRMNANDDVVDRCRRLGLLGQLHPANPTAWSVTTIAFMMILSSAIRFFGIAQRWTARSTPLVRSHPPERLPKAAARPATHHRRYAPLSGPGPDSLACRSNPTVAPARDTIDSPSCSRWMWSSGDRLRRTKPNPRRRPRACFLEIGRRCLSP